MRYTVADNWLGPLLPNSPDFTLRFQQIFFTIVPAILLFFVTPLFVLRIIKFRPKVRSGHLLPLKLTAGISLVGAAIANIVLWCINPLYRTNISITAATLTCLGSVCTCVILYAEHVYSFSPSIFLSIFLSLTLLFDVAKARSYFLRDGLRVLAGIHVAIAVLKTTILALEEVPKLQLVKSIRLRSQLSRETISGFWNRSCFIWLNSTLFLGFKSVMEIEQLPGMGNDFSSENLHARFAPRWDKG